MSPSVPPHRPICSPEVTWPFSTAGLWQAHCCVQGWLCDTFQLPHCRICSVGSAVTPSWGGCSQMGKHCCNQLLSTGTTFLQPLLLLPPTPARSLSASFLPGFDWNQRTMHAKQVMHFQDIPPASQPPSPPVPQPLSPCLCTSSFEIMSPSCPGWPWTHSETQMILNAWFPYFSLTANYSHTAILQGLVWDTFKCSTLFS